MKTIELRALHGVRNDLSLESFASTDLAVGDNIDIDEAGKTYRRLGTTRISSGVMHSLRSFENTALVVKNGTLGAVDTAGIFSPMKTGITARVAYTEIANEIYWSDGHNNSGVVGAGTNRNWGVVPPVLPAVSSGTGDLRGGNYIYTATFVRASGLESGAPTCGTVSLGDHGSLVFSAIQVSSDDQVALVRIYLSTVNGELPYLAAEIPNGQTSVNITTAPLPVLPVRTLNMGPPPVGQLLGFYNGRAYVGSGRFLWYSQPYEYELFDWTSGFLAFPTVLKTFAPVSTGIYLGTETETMYLDGADPQEFIRRQVAPYGTVLGTETYVRNDLLLEGNQPGSTPVWMSNTGLCLGMEGGVMKNLTSDRYSLSAPLAEGASILKIRSGTPQLITSLFA